MRDLLSQPTLELFEGNQSPVSRVLIARIAEAVSCRLSTLPKNSAVRKKYVREQEAAELTGVKVATLRAWRLRRSKTGPPFVRLGRMILYPLVELENHMQAALHVLDASKTLATEGMIRS